MKALVIGGAVVVVGGVAAVVAMAASGGNGPSAAPTAGPADTPAGATSAPGAPATSAPATTVPTTTVPTSAPVPPGAPVTIASGPCVASGCSTSSNRATFEFSSVGASEFECAVDGGAFAPCTSPRQVAAAAGRHSFQTQVAGQPDTVASFAWTVASDARVNASEVNNGVTMTSVGHACGGANGAWKYTVTMQGQSVSAEYHLHWTFGPGSRSAPVEGTGHMDSSGVQGTVTIEHGHMTFTASGNGFDGVAESDISANLVGPRAHPRLTFIQTGGTGTITGIAGSLFSFGGGAFGEPIHDGRAPGCQ